MAAVVPPNSHQGARRMLKTTHSSSSGFYHLKLCHKHEPRCLAELVKYIIVAIKATLLKFPALTSSLTRRPRRSCAPHTLCCSIFISFHIIKTIKHNSWRSQVVLGHSGAPFFGRTTLYRSVSWELPVNKKDKKKKKKTQARK